MALLIKEIDQVDPNDPATIETPLKWRDILRMIQYNILRGFCNTNKVSSELEVSVDSVCKMGLLLFTASIQNELELGPQHSDLMKNIRLLLEDSPSTTGSARKLRLWLFFIAASELHDSLERCWYLTGVRNTALRLGITTWQEVRGILAEFLWVGQAQDAAGRHLWREAEAFSSPVSEAQTSDEMVE